VNAAPAIASADDAAVLEQLAAALRGSIPAVPAEIDEDERDTARWVRPTETRWEMAT
jgi:hypothetical protein